MQSIRYIRGLTAFGLTFFIVTTAIADTWYVDKNNTTGTEDGTSWATAFTTIQPAIDAAFADGGGEVWVAAGVYDESRTQTDIYLKLPEPGTLVLQDGVDVYGGFTGTETDRDSRDWQANETIIDGSRSFEGSPTNHVLYGATAVFDGFTVTGGRSDGIIDGGGGMLVLSKSPRIANCIFRDNRSFDGAAVISQNGFDQSTSITNCIFTENEPISGRSSACIEYGGSGDFLIFNCVFMGNGVDAIDSRRECELIIDGCKFYDEADFKIVQPGERLLYRKNALYIGASSIIRNSYFSVPGRGTAQLLRCDGENVMIENCVFVDCGVDAPRPVGVLAFRSEGGMLRNCLFYNNNSAFGLIRIAAHDISVLNCTIVNNWGKGTALVIDREYLTEALTPFVQNCIVWGNSRDFEEGTNSATVSHSLIGTGFDGVGENNLTSAPLFRDPENGDFRLRYDSPCIDTGVDTALATTDLNGRPRNINLPGRGHDEVNSVDMGAYETPMLIHVSATNAKNTVGPDGHSWDSAFPTLQEGIDAAYSAQGGDVWVAKGTYNEDRTGNFTDSNGSDTGSLVLRESVSIYGGFNGDEIIFAERDATPGSENTIIDGTTSRNGSPAYHVVVGADNALVDGFTIQGGRADGPDTSSSGAGVWNHDASPRLENVRLRHNIATYNGGAIANTGSSNPKIVSSVIESNTAGLDGGGVFSGIGASVEVVDTALESNSAANGGAGAGEGAHLIIRNSTITENSASESGGAIFGNDATAQIDQTILSSNTAQQHGGAIAHTSGEFNFVNCLIAENESAGVGGGVVSTDGESSLLNSTVAFNIATSGAGGIHNNGAQVHFENSIAWGNGTDWGGSGLNIIRYSNIGTGHSEGIGNISTDPLFLNTLESDYRLAKESPCIDAGDRVPAPPADLLGKARPTGWGVEMGAYEKLAIVYVNKKTPADDTEQDGRSWETAFDDLQEAVDEAHAYGGTTDVWVAAGVYDESRTHYMDPDLFSYGDDEDVGCLVLRDGVHLYGGFEGGEVERSERDWNSNITLIDGANSRGGEGSIFMILAARDSSLDGFTITGKASGAAVMALEKEITIENCIFRNLTATSIFGRYLSELVIRSCIFIENSSDIVAVRDGCKVTIEDSLFSRNSHRTLVSNRGNTIRIARSTFSNNDSILYSSDDAQVAFTDCTFSRNYSDALGNHRGVGILRFSHSFGTITNSRILDNVGSVVNYQSNVRIRDSVIKGNESQDGGGVYVYLGSTLIENCLIAENHARRYGGGVYGYATSPLIVNTIFAGNTADVSGGASFNWGKDVSFNYPGRRQYGLLRSSLYVNCTFVGNAAPTAGGVGGRTELPTASVVHVSGPAEPYAKNCIFWENPGGDWVIPTSNIDQPPYIENCIIDGSANPLFVDSAGGDFRIHANSPAIDAGVDHAFLPARDYYGGDRIVGTQVDLGAHEYFNTSELSLAKLPHATLDEDTQIENHVNLLDFTSYLPTIDPQKDLEYSILLIIDAAENDFIPGQHVTIDESNNIDIAPAQGFNGKLTVIVQVTDGIRAARREFDITVNPVDDPTLPHTISISPNPGFAGVSLVCSVERLAFDQDVSYVDYEFEWFRSTDGTDFERVYAVDTNGLSSTPRDLPQKGEYWKCAVIAVAGDIRGAIVTDTVFITADSTISDITLVGPEIHAHLPYQAYVDVTPGADRNVAITYQLVGEEQTATVLNATHSTDGRYTAIVTFPKPGIYEMQAKVEPTENNLGSESNLLQIEVTKPTVTVALNTPDKLVRVGDTIEYFGALQILGTSTSQELTAPEQISFLGLPVELSITLRDEVVHTSTIGTSNVTGEFAFEFTPESNEEGRYVATASFGETATLAASESPPVGVDVRSTAGYAILIVGDSEDAQREAASLLTVQRVYTNLKFAGFEPDHVLILNGDPEAFDEDAQTLPLSEQQIEDSITNWAATRILEAPAPLYIVAIGERGESIFILSPESLKDRVDELMYEVASNQRETQPIIIINGFPDAQRYTDALSDYGTYSRRVVISSAGDDEPLFSGPIEESGVRDGDLFVSQLFSLLRRGYDINAAHIKASEFIRDYTSNLNGVNQPLTRDNALQHPTLDDNGDHRGTRYLTRAPIDHQDGFIARDICLGFDLYKPKENAYIAETTPSLRILDSTTPLFLYFFAETTFGHGAWLEAKSPNQSELFPGLSSRNWLNPDAALRADEVGHLTEFYFNYQYVDPYRTFDELGIHTIYYYLQLLDGTMAPVQRSSIFRMESNENLAPEPPMLLLPRADAHVSRMPTFDWSDTSDPEGDTLSYTLVLRKQNSASARPIVIENIMHSNYTWNAIYDDPSIRTQLTANYTWDVLAVDALGNSTFAAEGSRSFTIDNREHARPNTSILVHLQEESTKRIIEQATIELSSFNIDTPLTLQDIGGGRYYIEHAPVETNYYLLAEKFGTRAAMGPITIGDATLYTITFEIDIRDPYDVNGDERIDAADIQNVVNVVLGLDDDPVPSSSPMMGDINSDSRVDSIDLQMIVNRVLGVEI